MLATRSVLWLSEIMPAKTFLLRTALAVILLTLLVMAVWTAVGPRPKQGGWKERPLEGLGSFGAVPDFSLVERSGKQLKLADLREKVWIANFIYTHCKDTCPLQSAEMAILQTEFLSEPDVRLVSISVDPARDTPQVLSTYADRFKADSKRWFFLTGEKEEIHRLAQEGFRLSAVPASDVGQKDNEILHSPRFVLVDGKTQIRGYYDSRDAEALRRLRRDLKILLRG